MTHSTMLYEVTLTLDADLDAVYRPWLEEHIRQMLALPGFVGAQLLEVCDPPPPPGQCCYCVQYRLRDRAALDTYLHQHAAAMRAAGQARFGDRVLARRRILRVRPVEVSG